MKNEATGNYSHTIVGLAFLRSVVYRGNEAPEILAFGIFYFCLFSCSTKVDGVGELLTLSRVLSTFAGACGSWKVGGDHYQKREQSVLLV